MLKNKLLNVGLVILNLIIVHLTADNMWINRMPTFPEEEYTIIDFVYDYLLGENFLTIFMAIITVVFAFIINKYLLKQELKVMKYWIFFAIVLILNIIVHMFSINTAV